TSNHATAWYAIVATARCSRWPRSSAMSIASEKKRQWSALAWSQAQLSRERPANPGCHTPTLLDLVEERSTSFRASTSRSPPMELVFVTRKRHGDAAVAKQRRVEMSASTRLKLGVALLILGLVMPAGTLLLRPRLAGRREDGGERHSPVGFRNRADSGRRAHGQG